MKRRCEDRVRAALCQSLDNRHKNVHEVVGHCRKCLCVVHDRSMSPLDAEKNNGIDRDTMWGTGLSPSDPDHIGAERVFHVKGR